MDAQVTVPPQVTTLRPEDRTIAGKRVMITGANGGIGRALIAAFTAAGAGEIVAAVNGRQDPFEQPVRVLPLDITDATAVAETATRLAPEIDILVNNAGVNGNARFIGSEIAVARREMEVNYFGTLGMIHAFVPAMRERGSGTIINMMSVGSHMCYPTMGSYCASKAALHALTQALRAEISRYGIRVIGVFPPAVATQMTAHLTVPKITPQEVAATLVGGILDGREDVFVGPAADLLADFRRDPKAMERKLAQRIA